MKRKMGWLPALLVAAAVAGCGGGPEKKEKDGFFTSGSREADQRATQRMARDEQLEASGGNAKKDNEKTKGGDEGAAQAPEKKTLFDRLGGEAGITAIVEDFTPRALQDPRVNWARKGVSSGGFLQRDKSVTWTASPENLARLKKHMVQFLSLATGGPSTYQGKDMKRTHEPMEITNSEFDAVIGDLKATLDKLRIPNQEQKELLAIIESTRPQVVTQR